MNTKQAKKIQIINYLQIIDVLPQKETRGKYYYISPFRKEKDASFKVDANLNLWYDYGTGSGGNIIDLCMKINNTTVSGALAILSDLKISNDFFSFQQQKTSKQRELTIKHTQTLQNKALIQYLQSRKISLNIAKLYLTETYYKVNNKQYFALSFKNDKNGYELRNKYFKGSTSPKYYTTITGTHNTDIVNVFEGFTDFLSALVYFNVNKPKNDTIILNSLSLVKETLLTICKYKIVVLFLDNDNAGSKAVEFYEKHHRKVVNKSAMLFPKFKDFNDFLFSPF